MPGSGMEGDDEYGEEVIEGAEFSKIKRDKVFLQIDFNRRKTKIAATLGWVLETLNLFNLFTNLLLFSIVLLPKMSNKSSSYSTLVWPWPELILATALQKKTFNYLISTSKQEDSDLTWIAPLWLTSEEEQSECRITKKREESSVSEVDHRLRWSEAHSSSHLTHQLSELIKRDSKGTSSQTIYCTLMMVRLSVSSLKLQKKLLSWKLKSVVSSNLSLRSSSFRVGKSTYLLYRN